MQIRGLYLPNPLGYSRSDAGMQRGPTADRGEEPDTRAELTHATQARTGANTRPPPGRTTRHGEAEARDIYPASTSPTVQRALGAYNQNQGPRVSETLVGLDEYA